MSLLDLLLGSPLASDEEQKQRLGVAAGVPTFGLDALGSAAYGPEAALTILLPAGAAGLAYVMPLGLVIVCLLAVVYCSYRQTIAAYPSGGGSYTVAGTNLGQRVGLLAAAALMLDYLLDVAVGISTGVGALISAVPTLAPHTLALCLGILLVLTLVNLRGIGDTGAAFMAPTYVFIVCMLTVLGMGVLKAVTSGGHPIPVVPPPPAAHAVAAAGTWLLIRAFASGCTALTGVEAVSNGVLAFKDPNIRTASRTLTVIVVLLAIFLVGISYLTQAYGITATTPGTHAYQSLLSMLTAAVMGKGIFYYVCIGSVLVLLSLSANTAFAGFPMLCRTVAEDGYLPRFFAIRGRRLVYSEGIVVLALLAAGILVLFDGVTDRLIPLFAIGAFLAFTLSQAGMVMHWKRKGGPRSSLYMAINAFGAVATGCTVVIVLVAKFTEGAWMTVAAVALILYCMVAVHRHYARVQAAVSLSTLTLQQEEEPFFIVPVSTWDRASQGAIRFACSLGKDVQVLHITPQGEEGECATSDWQDQVNSAAAAAGVALPTVVCVQSPYRFVTQPIVQHVLATERELRNRTIAVVVPELVPQHWYQYLLHNHRSTALKAQILLGGNRRVIVINVPWYLK